MRHVYDIEIYPNLFHIGFMNVKTKQINRFQLSQYVDQREELIQFIGQEVDQMVGFNNYHFDYPLLHMFIKLYERRLTTYNIVTTLKAKANDLIASKNQYRNVIYKPLRPQIDLYKINHYDNHSKSTSLKMLEFNMRMLNIQELPFHHMTMLSEEQCEIVGQYCDNDLDATTEFYEYNEQNIELRQQLSESYNIDMLNMSDSKMGQEIFVSVIKKEMGITEIGKTYHDSINIGDLIVPYIKFKSDEFTALLNWFKNKTITKTKGVLSEIPFDEIEGLYYNKIVKKGKQKNLNTVYKGFQYDFGLGGIHGTIQPGVYESDDEWCIYDIDVSSYYPNFAIKNHLYPKHLSEAFCTVYEDVYNQRKQYPKKHPFNAALKLALNSVYGKSNSEFSPFFDSAYTMATTINGQLLLCLLAENLTLAIGDDNFQMLQINTDGMTFRVKRDKLFEVGKEVANWENLTKLELEKVEYKKMIIRDVNSYSAMYLDGSIKRKGAFTYKVGSKFQEREWHKNHGMLIIPKAVEKYFYQGIKPEDFMEQHEDIFDFFKRTKIKKTDRLTHVDHDDDGNVITERELQLITRYYVAYPNDPNAHTFIKIMPPLKNKTDDRRSKIEAGWLTTECSDLRNADLKEMRQYVNLDYYVAEANKIINAIETNQVIDDEDTLEEADEE